MIQDRFSDEELRTMLTDILMEIHGNGELPEDITNKMESAIARRNERFPHEPTE